MTTTLTTAEAIRTALAATTHGGFPQKAADLLAALGYRSDHVPPGQPASVGDFIADYPAPNPGTQSELAFADNAQSVRILFQFTDAEITSTTQLALLNAEGFSTGNARSFLFVAVELKGDNYARGQYVAFTRDINKRWQIPTVVLFRTSANRVTLAFVHRRPNRRDPERDVLGSVSLIREIDAANPHRAHLDILAELSLQKRLLWMDSHGKGHNFDGLLEAWLNALDTEALNRRFYLDLFRWFEQAVATAQFPTAVTQTVSAEEHVIRLITRLLFVWFIKEKGLVAEDLFIENQMGQLLNGYDQAGGDSYYRAVLQNLFFATLNTEISERRFGQQSDDDRRDLSLYRYRKEMAAPDTLLELFTRTPFINGGLFDCLDSFDGTRAGGLRIDCFTDNASQRRGYSIPNRLFFGEDGLITLFNRYKFTVEENTPAEREVALDPELLGKVFENLLAAFNPETRENVRKQTGSYYTPRAIVDYMVDEALVSTLAQNAQPADGNADFWQERLRYLLDYDDALADTDNLFTSAEKEAIVSAIAGTKALDPAVGSGAFPMGILHKLTLALRRLDPDNLIWENLQRELAGKRATVAFDTADQAERDAELQEISATFQRYRDSDFGRKLYLIQNSIYGVDIQPIATQIAKLRFFISLAIDQESTDEAGDNYGIKPLPNLETRFVAADSLLGLSRPAQMALGQTGAVKELQEDLDRNRERHFHANNRQRKLYFRRQDVRLRGELAKALQVASFSAGDADKIARWDPYDQNAHADWFDAEYMFGEADGFDVVIGNPPYISHDRIPQPIKDVLRARYSAHQGFADLYCYFIERAVGVAKSGGVSVLITSNSYLRADYGSPVRTFLRSNATMLQLLNIENSQVFDNVIVNVAITMTRKGVVDINEPCVVASAPLASEDLGSVIEANSFKVSQTYFQQPFWNLASPRILEVQQKIRTSGRTLDQIGTKIRLGIATGNNKAFVIDEAQRKRFCEKSPQNGTIIKPILRGRDIARYQYTLPGRYLLLTKNGVDVKRDYPDIYGHLDSFGTSFKNRGAKGKHWTNLRACSFFDDFKKERIVWIELTDTGRFALCNEEVYLLNSAYFLLPPPRINARFLLGILNSSTIRFYLNQIAGTSGMGTSRWINNYVKEFPIPETSKNGQAPIVRLVDRILAAKAANPDTDTTELEAEIDRRVYAVYGLLETEIAAVEGR